MARNRYAAKPPLYGMVLVFCAIAIVAVTAYLHMRLVVGGGLCARRGDGRRRCGVGLPRLFLTAGLPLGVRPLRKVGHRTRTARHYSH